MYGACGSLFLASRRAVPWHEENGGASEAIATRSGSPDTHLRVLRAWSAAILGLPSGAEHQ